MSRTRTIPLVEQRPYSCDVYVKLAGDLHISPSGRVVKLIPQSYGHSGGWEETGKRVTREMIKKIRGEDDSHQDSVGHNVNEHPDDSLHHVEVRSDSPVDVGKVVS